MADCKVLYVIPLEAVDDYGSAGKKMCCFIFMYDGKMVI